MTSTGLLHPRYIAFLMNIPSNVQKEIDAKLREVEELRNTAFLKELVRVCSQKNVSKEEAYIASKAFTNEVERAGRVENLKRARAERASKQEAKPATPV